MNLEAADLNTVTVSNSRLDASGQSALFYQSGIPNTSQPNASFSNSGDITMNGGATGDITMNGGATGATTELNVSGKDMGEGRMNVSYRSATSS